MTQNNLQKTQQFTAQTLVKSMTTEWAKVLPKVCTPERFARVVLSCLNGNRQLAETLNTQTGMTSLCSALMKCAELGLEPNGRDAHLIPFNSKGGPQVQFIVDYKGIVQLCRRTGEVANIIPGIVKDSDEFTFEDGTVHHKIDFRKPRGKSYAYYVRVIFKDGSEQCEVMSREDVEEVRKRSRSANNGPWVTDFDAMALKTVFKRLSKWLPLSSEVSRAVQYDNEDERDMERMRNVTPQAQRASRFSGKTLDEAFSIGVAEEKADGDAAAPGEPDYIAMIDENLIQNGVPCDSSDIRRYCEAKGIAFDAKDAWNRLKEFADAAIDYRDSQQQ